MSIHPSADRGDHVRLNCNMPRDEHARARALAAELGITLTGLVRAALSVAVETDGAMLIAPVPPADPGPKPDPFVPWALNGTAWRTPDQDDAPPLVWRETTHTPWDAELDGSESHSLGAES